MLKKSSEVLVFAHKTFVELLSKTASHDLIQVSGSPEFPNWFEKTLFIPFLTLKTWAAELKVLRTLSEVGVQPRPSYSYIWY